MIRKKMFVLRTQRTDKKFKLKYTLPYCYETDIPKKSSYMQKLNKHKLKFKSSLFKIVQDE